MEPFTDDGVIHLPRPQGGWGARRIGVEHSVLHMDGSQVFADNLAPGGPQSILVVHILSRQDINRVKNHMKMRPVAYSLLQRAQLFHRVQCVYKYRFQRKAGIQLCGLLYDAQDAVGQQGQLCRLLLLAQKSAGAFASDLFCPRCLLVVQGAAAVRVPSSGLLKSW